MTIISALRRSNLVSFFSVNPSQQRNTAMTTKYITSLAAFAALITFVNPNTASAAPASTSAPAEVPAIPDATTQLDPNLSGIQLIDIGSWEELVELLHFTNRYYELVLNAEFATGAQGSAKTILTKARKAELISKFNLLFDSFASAMQAFGKELPQGMNTKMLAHLDSLGCSQDATTKAWTGKCDEVYDSIVAHIQTMIPLAKQGEYLTNAQTLLEFSKGYEGGDKIILAYGAMGLLVTQVPDSARPTNWTLNPGTFEQAKKALENQDPTYHGNTLPAVVNEQLIRDAADKDLPVCVYKKGVTKVHCGEIDKASITPTGFTVIDKQGNPEDVKFSDIPANTIVTIGTMGNKDDFDQAKEAKEKGLPGVHGHNFAEDNLDKAKAEKLAGLEGVLYRKGKPTHKGVIKDVSDTGLKVGDEAVTFAELSSGNAYITIGEKSSEDTDGKNGKVSNHGFGFGAGVVYNMILAKKDQDTGKREFSTAHLPGLDVHVRWAFEKIPLRLGLGVQLRGLLGGVASHFTQLSKGTGQLVVIPYAEIAATPRLGSGRFGFDVSLLAGGSINGGAVVLAGFGPCGYFSWGDLCGAINGGHMNTGKIRGGNPTSPLEDPVVKGGSVGVKLWLTLYPENWGKKNETKAKASAKAEVKTQ